MYLLVGFMYDEDSRPLSVPLAGIVKTFGCISQKLSPGAEEPVPPLSTRSVAFSIIQALEMEKKNRKDHHDQDQDQATNISWREIKALNLESP